MTPTLTATYSVFKSLFDSAKALKDMNDAAVRHAAVIELQERIFTAQSTQATLLEQIGDLEKQVAAFETWETDKQRYEMSTSQGGSIVYSLKPEVQPSEPTHSICAKCYEHRKRSILQLGTYSVAHAQLRKPQMLICPECKSEVIA